MGFLKRWKRDENIEECERHNFEEENKITVEEIYLEELNKLRDSVKESERKKIEDEIKKIEKGIKGEKSLYYKFNRLNFPKFILQDVVIKYGNMEGQIDFMIFTPKVCFVIECKNWENKILINDKGHFLMYKPRPEKILSPVEQNNDHMCLIEKIHLERLQNEFAINSRKSVEDYYKPIVVLANNGQNVNDRYAPQNIRDVLIYAEDLVTYMKNVYEESAIKKCDILDVKHWMETFLNMHKENEQEYCKNRLQKMTERICGCNQNEKSFKKQGKGTNLIVGEKEFKEVEKEFSKTEIYKALATWRKAQSKEQEIAAFRIFTNRQLFTMVILRVETKDGMELIDGITKEKTDKYGESVLEIIDEYKEEVMGLSKKYSKLLIK